MSTQVSEWCCNYPPRSYYNPVGAGRKLAGGPHASALINEINSPARPVTEPTPHILTSPPKAHHSLILKPSTDSSLLYSRPHLAEVDLAS